jgi:hypothetical protein
LERPGTRRRAYGQQQHQQHGGHLQDRQHPGCLHPSNARAPSNARVWASPSPAQHLAAGVVGARLTAQASGTGAAWLPGWATPHGMSFRTAAWRPHQGLQAGASARQAPLAEPGIAEGHHRCALAGTLAGPGGWQGAQAGIVDLRCHGHGVRGAHGRWAGGAGMVRGRSMRWRSMMHAFLARWRQACAMAGTKQDGGGHYREIDVSAGLPAHFQLRSLCPLSDEQGVAQKYTVQHITVGT